MAAPRPRSLGSAVLRYSRDRVCALPLQQAHPLVRHTVRVALAAILTVVRTLCACVPSGDWHMDWPFTPCAPDLAVRDCLRGVAPGPVGVLSEFLRHLAPATLCLHRTIINTSLADGSPAKLLGKEGHHSHPQTREGLVHRRL
ncbi:trans-sialidase [Trypanosoma cruzi]|nr:trans-sialidase [Trypanosoma cruzi]